MFVFFVFFVLFFVLFFCFFFNINSAFFRRVRSYYVVGVSFRRIKKAIQTERFVGHHRPLDREAVNHGMYLAGLNYGKRDIK